MANTIPARQVKLEAVQGQFDRPYHEHDERTQTAWALHLLNHPSWQRVAAAADALVAEDGRPPEHLPSQKLAFHLLRIGVRRNLRTIRRFVQGSAEIRAALGLPPITPEALEQLGNTRIKEVREPRAIPSRTGLRDAATRWIEYPGRDRLLDTLADEAQRQMVDRILREFKLPRKLLAVDVTAAASGLKREGASRKDEGALHKRRRTDSRSFYHRDKGTLLTSGAGLIIGSVLATPSSEQDRRDELFEQLVVRSEQFKQDAALRGEESDGLDGAAIAGDTVISEPDFARRLEDASFYCCATTKGGVDEIVGSAIITRSKGTVENLVDYTGGGILYCSCDRPDDASADDDVADDELADEPKKKRRRVPMEQQKKEWTAERKRLKFTCTNPLCPHYNRVFLVTPKMVPSLNPLDHSDGFPSAANHIARNTIERYHDLAYDYFGLCANSHTAARRGIGLVLGETYNRFLYLLGDLVWNIFIEYNLKRGVATTERPLDEVFKAHQATAHQVAHRRAIARAAKEKRQRRGRKAKRARPPDKETGQQLSEAA